MKAKVIVIVREIEEGLFEECWLDEKGEYHRSNGLPAIIYSDGSEYYYDHGNQIRMYPTWDLCYDT